MFFYLVSFCIIFVGWISLRDVRGCWCFNVGVIFNLFYDEFVYVGGVEGDEEEGILWEGVIIFRRSVA